MKEELAVLVDDQDHEIEVVPKATLHTQNNPLHIAFSLYIFDSAGRVLAQQRKKEKKTWGGFWSNSCCGHPNPIESREEAAKRRSFEELGLNVNDIQKVVD